MSLPSGVVVGQGVGVPTEFSVKNGILQRSFPAGMASTASRGAAVKLSATVGGVDLADTTTTLLAGVLGQDTYDPSTLPASIAENIFADGILTYSQINQPTSVWKVGEFYVVNVSGTVNYGDFLAPAAGGGWVSTGATNNIKNGAVVCVVPNSVAGGAIQISVNLA
jgi:hypothetical protein